LLHGLIGLFNSDRSHFPNISECAESSACSLVADFLTYQVSTTVKRGSKRIARAIEKLTKKVLCIVNFYNI
jgi:hypothetical protein